MVEAGNRAKANDYDKLTRGKFCPLKLKFRWCDGLDCAWWDADKNRCAVLSLARNK